MFRRHLLDQVGRLLGILRPAPAPAPPTPALALSGTLTADAVLAPQAALVRRIRVAYGYPDDDFRQHLHAPIKALATWLHVLPGHPGGGFERRGGALEQALTNCLFSLQAADGRTFDISHTEAPSLHSTQKWRLACALGGLFVWLPDVLGRIEVVSEDGRVWPGIGMPLLDWLESLPATKYHYRWTAARKEVSWQGVYAASRCIDPDTMSFLASGDPRIAAALMSCIARSDHPTGEVSAVANKIAVAVAARERPCERVPPAEALAETLKRLFGTSDWLPNSPGGHVWYDGDDGLYLLWPNAAAKLLEAMPRGAGGTAAFVSHDGLLQHLADSGIVHASPSPLLHIRPPGHDKPHAAVRVADPQRVFVELGRRATPLDLQVGVTAVDGVVEEGATGEASAGDRACPPSRIAAAADACGMRRPEQRDLDFAEPLHDVDAARGLSAADSALVLDTSKITNPRVREVVDSVVVRLEQSFDSMLSRIVRGGVFVALAEFVGQHGDGAPVVRALHEAQLLTIDDATPDQRVVTERIEGVDVTGVVLCASVLRGYAEWKDRWQDADAGCSAFQKASRSLADNER